MKFNPKTRRLYSSSGSFLKEVRCPLGISSEEILPRSTGPVRCAMCSKIVVPIGSMQEREIEMMLRADPSMCVSFDLDTDHVEIIYGGT